MKKEYTIFDFKVNDYAYSRDIITASGYVSSYSGVYEINTSGILSRLIQDAGRFCESFASDLFIDWKEIEKKIDCDNVMFLTYLFGFRQNGVDSNSSILSRYNGGGYAFPEKEYRSMWRLDIEADGKSITMTLGRVF